MLIIDCQQQLKINRGLTPFIQDDDHIEHDGPGRSGVANELIWMQDGIVFNHSRLLGVNMTIIPMFYRFIVRSMFIPSFEYFLGCIRNITSRIIFTLKIDYVL